MYTLDWDAAGVCHRTTVTTTMRHHHQHGTAGVFARTPSSVTEGKVSRRSAARIALGTMERLLARTHDLRNNRATIPICFASMQHVSKAPRGEASSVVVGLLWGILRSASMEDEETCSSSGPSLTLMLTSPMDRDFSLSQQQVDGEPPQTGHVSTLAVACSVVSRRMLHGTTVRGNAVDFVVVPAPRGSLSSLRMQQLNNPNTTAASGGVPASDKVHLRIMAVGINFRDVLNVLGMYPYVGA